jgi:hypothetical protein
MIERFAIRTAQFRKTVVVVFVLGATAFAQTANPGATPTAPTNAQPVYTPLTPGERFHNYAFSLIGPMNFVTGSFSAAFGMWRNSPHEWPQGGEGFGLRFGSGYAQRIVRETLTYGSSSLFHQDNRYFRATETTTGGRLKHALMSTVTARRNDGSTTFAYCKVGSTLGGSFISRSWQPASTSGAENAMSNFGVAMAVQAGFNVAKEFMPNRLRRLIH